VGYIVIFPSVIAFWFRGYGVARIGPARAGQFVHMLPAFGQVLAMAILGERSWQRRQWASSSPLPELPQWCVEGGGDPLLRTPAAATHF
jgi:drug/metabolite transporter (DMT)-like permease